MEPFTVQILRRCVAGLSWENKEMRGVMWLQQAKSISQEEGDIPDKTEREEEINALPTIWMVLAMRFGRSTMEMVIVDSEDLDFVQMLAIGWIPLVLATVATEIETTD